MMGRSIGCGNRDVCSNSREDEAEVTRASKTYVWMCPSVGEACHWTSAEPGPES